jgi:hypothetical protein
MQELLICMCIICANAGMTLFSSLKHWVIKMLLMLKLLGHLLFTLLPCVPVVHSCECRLALILGVALCDSR